jgi:hypothetical protein
VVNRPLRTRGTILRALIGGILVVWSLPILAPLIVGALITRAIHGVCALTRGHGSDRGRDQ